MMKCIYMATKLFAVIENLMVDLAEVFVFISVVV
jgi:hypothetical protein